MAAFNNYQNLYPVGGVSPGTYANPQMPLQPPIIQQSQQQAGSFLMIQIQTDDEVNSYPVAAGTTVMLINFGSKKFWLKSTNTSGVPEPIRRFTFDEEITQSLVASNVVTREEFNSLNEKLEKLLKDLGGDK